MSRWTPLCVMAAMILWSMLLLVPATTAPVPFRYLAPASIVGQWSAGHIGISRVIFHKDGKYEAVLWQSDWEGTWRMEQGLVTVKERRVLNGDGWRTWTFSIDLKGGTAYSPQTGKFKLTREKP